MNEENLWLAVVEEAFRGLEGDDTLNAINFFKEENGMFDFICDHLDMDRDKLQKRILSTMYVLKRRTA